jgi:hypothetical protein
MNAVLAAAGYNIRWLLRQIVKKGLTFLEQFFLRLQQMGWQAAYTWRRLLQTLKSWLQLACTPAMAGR